MPNRLRFYLLLLSFSWLVFGAGSPTITSLASRENPRITRVEPEKTRENGEPEKEVALF